MASNQPIWPRRATITVAPGMVPLSTSRLNASDILESRAGESPRDSGLACGSGGVWGLRAGLAAVCAFIVFSRWLLSAQRPESEVRCRCGSLFANFGFGRTLESLILVWFWFGSSLGGLAAELKRTSKPPHQVKSG